MSTDISAKFADCIFSGRIIEDEINSYFKSACKKEKYDIGKYLFKSFYPDDDILLYFIDIPGYWDADIIAGKYFYRQCIIFETDKFSDIPGNFDVVMKFIIYLQKKFAADVFVTSTVHDDICYINERSEIIWSDKYGYNKLFHMEQL